jgi:glycosyltransferase involved in cell wall biosynthesis
VRCYHDGPVQVHALPQRRRSTALRLWRSWRFYERTLLNVWYSADVARYLRALHRRTPFDLVEFAEVLAEGWSYMRASVRPAPAVVRCHTPTALLCRALPPGEPPYEWRKLDRCEASAVVAADACSAPSAATASAVAAWAGIAPTAITVVPNPVPLPEQLAQGSGNPPSVLLIGRYEPAKGTHLLAEAIPAVLSRTRARFTLAGADRPYQGRSMRAWLQARLEQAGCADAVELHGHVADTMRDALYRRADLALAPSTAYESFSYTAADAMAYGLPVIASAIGGLPETLGDAGVLVTPGDVGALAQALVELAEQPERRRELGRRARARVCEHFEASTVAGRMAAFYEATR